MGWEGSDKDEDVMIELFNRRRLKKRKTQKPNPAATLFRLLKSLGPVSKHLADLGSHHGNWTRRARAALGFARTKVEMCCLDTVMGARDQSAPEIVRIDAEGFDLQGPDGAASPLATAEEVVIEAAVANPSMSKTIAVALARIKELGRMLFHTTDLNRTPDRNALWLVEAVFIRKGGALGHARAVYR